MDTLPRNILFGMIVFVFMLLGIFTIISEMVAKEPDLINDNRYGVFTTNLKSLNSSMQTKLSELGNTVTTDTVKDAGEFGWLSSLVGKGWLILKGIGSYFQFGITAFQDMSNILGIPSWIVGIAEVTIFVTIAFAIISALFQKDV